MQIVLKTIYDIEIYVLHVQSAILIIETIFVSEKFILNHDKQNYIFKITDNNIS